MSQITLPPIAVDFETYYAKDYSITKMGTVEYVMDPKFEVVGFAYVEITDPPSKPRWFSGTMEQVKAKLLSLKLDRRRVIAHHAMFDAAVVEWIFKIQAAEWFCTMMGARPYIVPFAGSASLAKCAEFFNLPTPKGEEVKEFIGFRRADFTPFDLDRYGAYCCNDIELSVAVYHRVMKLLPQDEVDIIKLTVEKFIRGRLVIDTAMLEEAKNEIELERVKGLMSLAALGLKEIDVSSNPRFANALKNLGVDPPKKISATTGNETYAFAKKDPEFLALQDHPDPKVQTLVAARLLLKSNIERSRIESFLSIARLLPFLPVPLLYYGAHTGRFSGMMGINMQNLPRGSALRTALRAPPGYKVVTADLSQIEARIVAVLAGQWDLVEQFRLDQDVYSEFATDLYGYPVSKKDPKTADERFVGKMGILGLGYGMGTEKFDTTLQAAGRSLGGDFVAKVVALYRRRFGCIPRLWRRMDAMLAKMMEIPKGAHVPFPEPDGFRVVPCLRFERGRVMLPNGMPIHYPKLTRNKENRISFYSASNPSAGYNKDIWGGGLTENVVQALARIVISRAELRLARAGLKSVLQVHDELVCVVPEAAVPKVVEVLKKVLTDPVPWMPSLPLACEIGVGDSYGEAK